MENYKLVNSKKVQEKCERLGLKEEMLRGYQKNSYFVYINNGYYYSGEDRKSYIDTYFKEITQADFLALPEPFKKGDMIYIGTTDKEQVTVCKVDKVTSKDITDTWGSIYEFADFSDIRLATKEEIRVLGLEE